MKRMMFGIIGTIFGVLLLAACGQTGDTGGDTPAPSGTAIEAGENVQTLLKNNCMSCHGNDLEGRVGPSLLEVGSHFTEEELYSIVADGTGVMPGFKSRLDEQEINALVTWLADQKEGQ